jgi:phosphatidylcholine synthase
MSSTGTFPPVHRAAAWGVHIYTALGLPLALLAAGALWRGNAELFFVALWTTCVIDATDGALARKLRVKDVLPAFNGRRLDDIIDFITFVFLPALALPALGILPEGYAWVAAAPLLSSAYGFCQENAKTDDAFVGFPSYWNIVVLYLYVLEAPPAWAIGTVVVLSVLVFVPIHYVYPSRTRLLMPVTVVFGSLWAALTLALALAPHASWAYKLGWISMSYPIYYFALSFVHHARVHRTA